MLLVHSAAFQILKIFRAYSPEFLLQEGAHPTLTYSHARPALRAIRAPVFPLFLFYEMTTEWLNYVFGSQ